MQITSPGSAYYVSDCCKAEITIGGKEGEGSTRWFSCEKCQNPCNRLVQVWYDESDYIYLSESEYLNIQNIGKNDKNGN